eukprot:1715733-Prymnesium_polylepis.1
MQQGAEACSARDVCLDARGASHGCKDRNAPTPFLKTAMALLLLRHSFLEVVVVPPDCSGRASGGRTRVVRSHRSASPASLGARVAQELVADVDYSKFQSDCNEL